MRKRTIALLTIIAGVAAGQLLSHERYPDRKTPVAAKLTAQQLVTAYHSNGAIYDGKRVQVRGTVTKIGDDYVRLAANTVLEPRLQVRRSATTEGFRRGDKVEFICTADGMSLGGVVLRRCDYVD